MEAKKDGDEYCFKNVKEELQNIIDKEKEEEEMEILKKKISSHPLYGLLLHTHLDCLKVSCGQNTLETDAVNAVNLNKENFLKESSVQASEELDRFMEAYCLALRSLKEAMEKPINDTHRFVDAMYTELGDVVLPPGN